jgi:hypothetical protein
LVTNNLKRKNLIKEQKLAVGANRVVQRLISADEQQLFGLCIKGTNISGENISLC